MLYVVVMIVVNHDQLKKSDIVYDLLLVSLLSDGKRKIFTIHCQHSGFITLTDK